MESKNNLPAEDKPAENKPVEKTSDGTATPKKGFMDRALPWVIVALVAFLAGALVTYFAVYQPKVAELTSAQNGLQAELTAATDDVASIQAELDTAKADLQTAQNDLAAAQTTIEEQTTALAKSEQLVIIYKFEAGVNSARATLSKLDPASSRQALTFVANDLAELEQTNVDPAALSGFKAKIEEAEANLESTPQKSLEALEALYSNLLLLISNLE